MFFEYATREGTDGLLSNDSLDVAVRHLWGKGPHSRNAVLDLLARRGHLSPAGDNEYRLDWSDQPLRSDWESPEAIARFARSKALSRDRRLCEQIKERDANRCRYCGIRVNWNDRSGSRGGTYDHVDPDGINSLDNVVVSCRRCNSRKGHRTPEQASMALMSPRSTGADAEDSGAVRASRRLISGQPPASPLGSSHGPRRLSPDRADPGLTTGQAVAYRRPTHSPSEHPEDMTR
jgi:DNA-directed RNA polymerase subunit RPC12/RpoP